MLENEIIYNKGDQAEELYFIFDGSVMFFNDLSDHV
jgi:CRP-like cAMP-binding protein